MTHELRLKYLKSRQKRGKHLTRRQQYELEESKRPEGMVKWKTPTGETFYMPPDWKPAAKEQTIMERSGYVSPFTVSEKQYEAIKEAERISKKGPVGWPKAPPIVKHEAPTITPEHIPSLQETGFVPGRTVPFVEEGPPPSMLVPSKTRAERETESRESMKYVYESPFEMAFAPPKPKVYYEEKFGPLGVVPEFTSAAVPVAVSMFDPRQWTIPQKDIKLSEMSPTMWMHKGTEYVQEEPVKVAGFGAGYAVGAIAFGKISSYIGGKLPGRKQYKVEYWKGTWKTEKGRTPYGYEYIAEMPSGKPDVGLRYLDTKTVKRMTKPDFRMEYKGLFGKGVGFEQTRKMGSLFETKIVSRKPAIPDLILTAETKRTHSYLAFGPDDFIFGRRTVSARVPVEFEKDTFKPLIMKGRDLGKGRPFGDWKYAFPEGKPGEFKFDFYRGLVKGGAGKAAPSTVLKAPPKPKPILTWKPVPIGVEEATHPAMYPPAIFPGFGKSFAGEFSFKQVGGTVTGFKPKITEKPKEIFKFEPRLRFKQAPINVEKMGLGFKHKPLTMFKPAVAYKEKPLQAFKPALGFKEKPIFKPKPAGWPKFGPPILPPPTPLPPLDFGFGPRRRRRKKKAKPIFRKYRYTPTLGGALFRKPIPKAPKILTGLRMRPKIKRKKKSKKRRR